ncbi:MAG: hypothetical protein WC523_06755 [Patescibacteria group bacterium]|jgi:hypothetical protein
MKKSFFFDVLLAILAALLIMVISGIILGFIPEQTITVNYFTGLAIYLVIGLMILKKAGRKVISFFACLTVTLIGAALLFFFLGNLIVKNALTDYPGDELIFLRPLTTLHQPFIYTALILFILMEMLISNVLRNPKITAHPWAEPRERNPYWHFDLTIDLINFLSAVGSFYQFLKHYRSFLKVLAVSVIFLIIGQIIILIFDLTTKESQAIVWWFGGFASFLFLGRKLIKSNRKIAIFSLLATSLVSSSFLIIFWILSFFRIYGVVSQTILSWPVFFSLVILGCLIPAGWTIYYKNLPERSYREKIREWLKSGEELIEGKIAILMFSGIGLLFFGSGSILLILTNCLAENFSRLANQIQGISEILMFLGAILIILMGLLITVNIIRENYLASISPEERAAFEKKEAEINANNKGLFSDPFNNSFPN